MKRASIVRNVCLALAAEALLLSTVAASMVTPNTRTFTAGQQEKIQGVIISRDGNTIKLRANDDSIGTIDLTNETKIQLKKGWFGHKDTMDATSLVPGLQIEADGKGNEKGDLVASRVLFDPNSMRATRQIDTRVSPLEARTGTLENRTGQLEGRTGTLESRAGEMETKQTQLADQQKQTDQQVGQVKQTADQANQGVTDVNTRVTDLDNYQPTDTVTVYFRVNSATLSAQDKEELDGLAQKALAQKGYIVEVAGFADKTGNAALNQSLSERRAETVTNYLAQNGNIPIHRILTPTGMGTSHEAAENNTPQGRKMNRRVEVKILVNQGVVAGSKAPPNPTQPPSDTSK